MDEVPIIVKFAKNNILCYTTIPNKGGVGRNGLCFYISTYLG